MRSSDQSRRHFTKYCKRTTANEPLRIVQQTKRTEVFQSVARDREEIRSEERVWQQSASAALISNISERDRAKDEEQFDDILRTFINETNKFENRFGTNTMRKR